VDFGLTEEEELVRRTAREFAERVLVPRAAARDVSGEFPPELRVIEYAPLRTLLASIDPTLDSTAESGAVDWANLRERVHYIADLFRCWHARPELFTAPFTPEQVTAMRDGRRPDGSL
jgi:alkylation response protein AidB-like acyl-CoA dehydrogenase